MKLTRLKNLKKVVAVALAGTMVFGLAGCGKKEEEKKKKEKLPIYEAVVEAEFDGTIDKSIVIDDVMYASYYNWNMEDESGLEEVGLVTYDFKTKEKNQIKLDEQNTYINDFYVDGENNINITGMKIVEKTDENNDTENVGDETFEDYNFSYSEVKFVYNSKLECISKEDGEMLDEDVLKDEMLMDVEVDNEGRKYSMYVKLSGESEEYCIKVTDKEDKEIANIITNEMVDSMIRMADGSVACNTWTENGNGLYKIDVEGNKLGENIIDITDSFALGMYPGLNNSILLNEGEYLKRINCDTNKLEKVFKFSDCEILADNIVNIIEQENGEFYVVLQDYESNKSEIDRLTKQDENSNTVKKEELYLGTFSLNSDLQAQVIKFNKSNDKYKIIINDYMSDDEDEYEEALKRFQASLTSSNCPDIIDLSSVSINEYVRKGVLESLETYLENDSEIKEEIFVQSILNKYKVNDKIYTIPIDFTIAGLAGAKSKLGEDCSWTMKEFVEYAENLPEGTQMMQDMTSDGVLWTMLYYSMDEYVDWTTGECNFNSEDFIELLKFCSNFENSEDFYEDFEYDEEIDAEISLIRDNKIVLRDFYCESFLTYLEEKAIFGEDITIKGYPSKENNGIVIESFSPLLGISTKSKYKDVAWEFIRQLYTKENQTSFYGLSIRQDKLDESLDEIKNMKVHTADDGTKYISTYGYNEIELYIPPITDEDVKEIQAMIDSADTIGNMNGEIFGIIEEETEAFFKGKKSAKDVADVIQSRVSIYVKENR